MRAEDVITVDDNDSDDDDGGGTLATLEIALQNIENDEKFSIPMSQHCAIPFGMAKSRRCRPMKEYRKASSQF